MDIRGIVILTSAEFIQVVLKDLIKQKMQKWERKKLQPNQESFRLLVYSGSEIQQRHFCRTCKRTENRRTYLDRCRLRKDEINPVWPTVQ